MHVLFRLCVFMGDSCTFFPTHTKSGTFGVPGGVQTGRGTADPKSGTSREIRDVCTVKRKSFETPKVRRTQLHPFLVFRNSFPIEFRDSISEFRNSIIKSFESPKMDAAESSSLLVFRNSSDPEFRNTSFGKNHCFCLLLLTLAFG